MPAVKIRQLTTNNKSGDAFGITIARGLAERFEGVLFRPEVTNEGHILLRSGCWFRE